MHRPEHLQLIEDYLTDHLLPVATPFSAGHCGVEWWCNTNNDLDWHIDKDEAEGRTSGSYVLPLLSTVFYPHVSCAGGELLVADNPPIAEGYVGPLPVFRSVISIPPCATGWCCSHRASCTDQSTRGGALLRGGEHLGPRTDHHIGFSATGLNFSIDTLQARIEICCRPA